ncbi:transposase [Paracoccus cavernae]|uniref:Transposase n=1 Tax=Paracoccus cavernae TaxID=1571207 RepID=A0ABT8D1F0_9RHOB|nr:transposase [Paracoccus cavernae]
MPRQHSTGGKQRLGATTKIGERALRRLLIIDAKSVIIKRHVHVSTRPGTWLGGMLTRKPPMLVRVTLANNMARIVWAMMDHGDVYKLRLQRHKPSRSRGRWSKRGQGDVWRNGRKTGSERSACNKVPSSTRR